MKGGNLNKQIEILNKRIIELEQQAKESSFQSEEKEKRAEELIIANKELAYQNDEKEKRANELRKSEEKYRLLSENAHDWVYWIAPDGKWQYISPSCEIVTGYTIKEFTKNPNLFEEITYPEDRKITKQHLAQDQKEREADYLELRIITKSGDIRWISHTCNPVYTPEGQYMGRRGINSDITVQKLAERELQENEEFSKRVIESSNDCIKVLDLEGNLLSMSKGGQELLEIDDVSIYLNKNWTDFWTGEDNIAAKKAIALAKKGKLGKFSGYSPTEKGTPKWWEIFITPIKNSDDKVERLLAISRDITDRKHAEKIIKETQNDLNIERKKIESIFRVAPTGIGLISNRIILQVNKRVCEMTGYSSEELVGKKSRILYPSRIEFDSVGTEKYRQISEKGTGTVETQWKKKNGEIIDIILSSTLLVEGDLSKGVTFTAVDITERTRVLKELEQSKTKYKLLADYTFDWEYWIDKEGEYIFVSPACEKASGYTASEFIDNPNLFFDIIHPEYREKVQKHFASESGIEHFDFSIQFVIKHANGENRWIEHSCNPVFDNIGKHLGRRGVNRDITLLKKSIQNLDRLKQAIQVSTEVVFMTDENGIFTFVNPRFTELYGFKPEEVIGKETPRILNSGQTSNEEHRIFWENLLKKTQLIVQYVNKCKDGELIDIEASADPILDDSGKIIGFLAIQRDITKRKHGEKIQKVMYNISNAVPITNSLEKLIILIQQELGTIIDTTNFYIALYDSETDMLSLPFFADEKDNLTSLPAGKTLTKYVISTQKALLVKEKQLKELDRKGMVKKFGTNPEVWLGVPLKVDKEITGAIVVQSYTNENAYDESDKEMLEFVSGQVSLSIERKKAEDNLIIALEKATESDRLKSAFLATMSHELRTPLNAIIGFSDLIEEKSPIDDIMDFRNIINRSGNHLLRIVEDIFDITLIESGEINIKKEDIELSTVFNDVHEIIKIEQLLIGKQNLEVNSKLPLENNDLILYTDASKLKQILINLLKNSLKFTHEGYINYGYTIETIDKEEFLKFYVEDTGIGINEDQQEHIFNLFRQVADSHTRVYGGTGIGLSISKKITELLGGEIWVESALGKGAIFYFTIPFENKALVEIANQTIDKIKTVEERKLDKKTILIVEDVDSNFEFLKIILEKAGVLILWAKNGKEAINICLENQEIDLVLMDIRMPIMNGYDATKEIKRFKPDLPIIAQTANAVAGDHQKALEVGCDDYIAKPISKKKLIKLIEHHIN